MAAFYRHLFLKATSKFFARVWLVDEDADPFAAEYAVVEHESGVMVLSVPFAEALTTEEVSTASLLSLTGG